MKRGQKYTITPIPFKQKPLTTGAFNPKRVFTEPLVFTGYKVPIANAEEWYYKRIGEMRNAGFPQEAIDAFTKEFLKQQPFKPESSSKTMGSMEDMFRRSLNKAAPTSMKEPFGMFNASVASALVDKLDRIAHLLDTEQLTVSTKQAKSEQREAAGRPMGMNRPDIGNGSATIPVDTLDSEQNLQEQANAAASEEQEVKKEVQDMDKEYKRETGFTSNTQGVPVIPKKSKKDKKEQKPRFNTLQTTSNISASPINQPDQQAIASADSPAAAAAQVQTHSDSPGMLSVLGQLGKMAVDGVADSIKYLRGRKGDTSSASTSATSSSKVKEEPTPGVIPVVPKPGSSIVTTPMYEPSSHSAPASATASATATPPKSEKTPTKSAANEKDTPKKAKNKTFKAYQATKNKSGLKEMTAKNFAALNLTPRKILDLVPELQRVKVQQVKKGQGRTIGYYVPPNAVEGYNGFYISTTPSYIGFTSPEDDGGKAYTMLPEIWDDLKQDNDMVETAIVATKLEMNPLSIPKDLFVKTIKGFQVGDRTKILGKYFADDEMNVRDFIVEKTPTGWDLVVKR